MQNLVSKVRTGLVTVAGSVLYGATALAQGTGFLSPEDNVQKVSDATGGASDARTLVLRIVNFFLGFLGLLAVLMIIYGGVLIVTSAGDSEKAGKGKKILLYAAIGILIILLSFAIVSTVLNAGLSA
ncbi:hypothetical protein IT412_01985 [Candidatus Peregrinibacteria bacterium]|nr:hypothetical protein [Candidatus Peregrinibacteria bacterium]